MWSKLDIQRGPEKQKLMLIIIASPPDFLAVVVADEEGDGEEEHHDCAQDDHKHLLICQPTLRRSEIVKYDPPCDNSLNQEEMNAVQCRVFLPLKANSIILSFSSCTRLLSSYFFWVCSWYFVLFLSLLGIYELTLSDRRSLRYFVLFFSKPTCLRGWYRPWRRGDRGRPRGGCWRWCTWWTPRPRAWSRARPRSECRWSCSSSLWRHNDLRDEFVKFIKYSSVAKVYLSWYWKTKSRIFLSMKDSAYCLLLYLKTMFSLNCHHLYQSIYSLPTKSKLWCIFASAMV